MTNFQVMLENYPYFCYNRPLSGALVKYRKNTDKKGAKIQKNTEKIQKKEMKYRIFCDLKSSGARQSPGNFLEFWFWNHKNDLQRPYYKDIQPQTSHPLFWYQTKWCSVNDREWRWVWSGWIKAPQAKFLNFVDNISI